MDTSRTAADRLPAIEEVRVLATDGTDVFDSEYMSGNWEWCWLMSHALDAAA
jgi:hypothetical protein